MRARVIGAALLAASAVGGQTHPPLPNVGPPLILRLVGTFAPTKDAARKAGFDVASLALVAGKERTVRYLGVDEARTVGGDQPLDGRDVLAAVAPFDPSLIVPGPPALVRRLAEAPPGSRVRVEGLVDTAGRTYLLRDVQVEPPPR